MTRIVRWEGVVSAVSSIVHSEQSLGTVRYLRRERFLLPTGEFEDVPVISGNAWRGLLRRECADLWWQAVGEPKLTLAVAHAIWSGGALAKSSGVPLSGNRLVKVREYCPVIGLFGTAGGGRIVEGRVQIGKMIPICEETKHVIPEKFLGEETSLPSLWDLTQIEYYSKFPADLVNSEKVENSFLEKNLDPNEEKTLDSDEDVAMARFGVESFVAGTKFYTWASCSWASNSELSLFVNGLNNYMENAVVGGFLRNGHGVLNMDLQQIGDRHEVDAGLWKKEIAPREDFLEVLAWMD
jgi:CRISPR type IV-associated protein Csf2